MPKTRKRMHSCNVYFDLCPRCGQKTYCPSHRMCVCFKTPISEMKTRSKAYQQLWEQMSAKPTVTRPYSNPTTADKPLVPIAPDSPIKHLSKKYN